MRIVREAELARDRRLARLGPDLLAPGMTAEAAAAALRRAGPDAELGDALLDQELLAGIGNIFKSESCWAVKVDPWRSLGEVGDEELAAVAGAARDQMLEAVAQRAPGPRGSTAGPRRPCPRCRTADPLAAARATRPARPTGAPTARVSLWT